MRILHTFDYRQNKSKSSPNRIAVRAVIINQNSLFLVHLKTTNEYKFPGGGVEENEFLLDALKREVLEESGATITKVKECLGYIDQIYPDKFNHLQTFYMRSIYYLCEISETFAQQHLSNQETALNFSPVWVDIQEAINTNKRRIDNGIEYHWTERELWMFEFLKAN